MATPVPIDWGALEDAILFWLESSTGVQWIWRNQAAPQPAYPYGSVGRLGGVAPIAVRDEVRLQLDDADPPQPTGELKIVGQRDFVASCQLHVGPPGDTEPACHAFALMSAAVADLATEPRKDAFREVGLAIRERGQPTELDIEIGGQWISRAQVDVRFGVASVLENTPSTRPGFFDKVEVSSTILGTQTAGSRDLVDELLDPNA